MYCYHGDFHCVLAWISQQSHQYFVLVDVPLVSHGAALMHAVLLALCKKEKINV